MEKKFNIQPHQDWSAPQDAHLQQVVDHEDRLLLRELERMQRNRMQHFAELIDRDPKLRAMCHSRSYDGSKFDMSALEKRVEHLPLHFLKSDRGPDVTTVTGRIRDQNMSDRLIHGGIVRSPVARYPRASDNLPKGEVKIDPIQLRQCQENVRVDINNGEDWYRAMVMGLAGDPVGSKVATIDSIHSTTVIAEYKAVGGPVGRQARGRALRRKHDSDWQSTERDRAATPAAVRKKLRSKTRAQKKARRKQR